MCGKSAHAPGLTNSTQKHLHYLHLEEPIGCFLGQRRGSGVHTHPKNVSFSEFPKCEFGASRGERALFGLCCLKAKVFHSPLRLGEERCPIPGETHPQQFGRTQFARGFGSPAVPPGTHCSNTKNSNKRLHQADTTAHAQTPLQTRFPLREERDLTGFSLNMSILSYS